MTDVEPLVVNGVIIDLSHLVRFEFSILPKDWENCATVRVAFNNHCFTQKFDPQVHAERIPWTHAAANDVRGFDQIRYNMSKRLPDLIRRLDGQRIAQTRKSSLVRLTLECGLNYAIFFSLKKAGNTVCDLFVLSAYPLDQSNVEVAVTGEMKFNVAVAKVLEGKTLKFPPGRF